MEELFLYALLLYEGLDLGKEYKGRLDELFVKRTNNESLADLKYLSNDIEASVIYIRTHFCYNSFDYDTFGRMLMKKLRECYDNMEIKIFASKMYSLWKNLPSNIQNQQPFFTLCYADAPLSWGDEKGARELYENMLSFYDR